MSQRLIYGLICLCCFLTGIFLTSAVFISLEPKPPRLGPAPMTVVALPNTALGALHSTPALPSSPRPAPVTRQKKQVEPTPDTKTPPVVLPVPPAITDQPLPPITQVWHDDDPRPREWETHAVQVELTGKPLLVIIIDDMGVSPKYSRQMIAIDAPLTLSFLPYAENLDRQLEAARTAGHELMLHLPMQPLREDGTTVKDTLRVTQSDEDNLAITRAGLAAVEGIVGVNNHTGSRFTADGEKLLPIMTEIAQRGLLFLDSKTSPRSVVTQIAAALGQPPLARDIFLDHEQGESYAYNALERSARLAQQRGYAIALGHPKTDTVNALRRWLRSETARKVQIVPLSMIAKK